MSSHKKGSVIVDKTYEALDVAMKAYYIRLSNLVELPRKLKKYFNVREEKFRLVVHQQQIRDTQTLLKGLPPALPKGPMSLRPTLDTIMQVSLQKTTQTQSLRVGERKKID